MAWITQRKRSDGGVSATVVWRHGGSRAGAYQSETFGAGSDAQNLARAEGFKKMVDAAGQRWPDGWVKGQGFVRPDGLVVKDPLAPPPKFVEVGEEYVRQIVDLSPGQRKKYLGQLGVLEETEIGGRRIFDQPIDAITAADLKAWLIEWDRALKTKSNYHALMHGVFAYAVEKKLVPTNPAVGTAPKQSRVKQSRPELRFLSERELVRTVALAGTYGDLISVTVATGLRFGEVTALWVSDVDIAHRTIRVNKAWKAKGEDGLTETPGWLARQLRTKHVMRGHYLGNPKTPKSRRTIGISPAAAKLLAKRIEGKGADDFVFTSRTGRPLHNSDFYTHVWSKLMKKLDAEGIARFRFHDLRHTHVAWLIAGGAPLPHIQARLGHESITTTIDTYGHLLSSGDELISGIIDTGLAGKTIRARAEDSNCAKRKPKKAARAAGASKASRSREEG